MQKANKKEQGSAVDLFEVMLVFVIISALMLLYLDFAKSIRMKMAIDLAAKNTLYQMEETGAWTDEIDKNFRSALAENGIHLTPSTSDTAVASKDNSNIDLKSPQVNKSSGIGTVSKAKNGEQVKMDITIYFYTPMKDVFGKVWIGGAPEKKHPITYHIVRSTVCRN